MITSRFYSKIKKFWLTDSFGNYAVAFFLIAVASGILLAVSYTASKASESVSLLLIKNSAAVFIRNLHYWSAQLFIVFSILHIWEHLILKTETKLRSGVWSRLTFALFVIFFVMITGFISRGDADSLQALRIIRSLTEKLPLLGSGFSYWLFGTGNNLEVIYFHHIATATIFLIFIIIEHSKIIWPKVKTFLYSLLTITLVSIYVTPLFKTRFDLIIRGPWYFLGLQEVFHYLSNPGIVLLFLLFLFILFWFIPRLKGKAREANKNILTITFLIYFGLTIFAFFFRGRNWNLEFIGLSYYQKHFQTGLVNPFYSGDSLKAEKVNGIYEGCLSCHKGMKGFSPAHNPQALGCYACHGGNPFTLKKSEAHAGLIKVPGNLSTAEFSCGNASCHPDLPARVKSSIMNRISGVISVDRYVFNELKSPNDTSGTTTLGESPADKHLRQLCVSCHLGNAKESYGKINQKSRGGGCNACHLNYSREASAGLNKLKSDGGALPEFHPSLSVNIPDLHCYGCHSRSSRISLNYTGYKETQLEPSEIKNAPPYKVIEDGRVLKFVNDDVHHQKGLSCVDCHISRELMGNGRKYEHKIGQLIIQCKDCHSKQTKAIPVNLFKREEAKTFELLKLSSFGDSTLVTSKGNYPIINAIVKNGKKILVSKSSGKTFPLKAPSAACLRDSAHQSLSCNACHTSWAPQCIGCHTQYFPKDSAFDYIKKGEVKGAWREAVGKFFALPPTLGVRTINGKNIISTFTPGMILTIQNGTHKIFKRLFAPISAHTTLAKGRSCKSCHNNPLAIGYGRGELKYSIKNGTGKWIFNSTFANRKEDGLPEDAWIGFLEKTSENRATRINIRPFNPEEQKRILTVGACLTCHKAKGKVMKMTLKNFKETLRHISKRCILPDWRH